MHLNFICKHALSQIEKYSVLFSLNRFASNYIIYQNKSSKETKFEQNWLIDFIIIIIIIIVFPVIIWLLFEKCVLS